MKAFIAIALFLAIASASGYFSSSNIASSLESAFGGEKLNNPYSIFAVVGAGAMGWVMCSWMSFFGGNYRNCMYTHLYYALE